MKPKFIQMIIPVMGKKGLQSTGVTVLVGGKTVDIRLNSTVFYTDPDNIDSEGFVKDFDKLFIKNMNKPKAALF